MCGRYVAPNEAEIERAFGLTGEQALQHLQKTIRELGERRFDVRPTQRTILLYNREAGDIEKAQARWGFIPFWSKDEKPKHQPFNARSETAASQPMWRDAYRKARCLVPMLGWYEWKEVSPGQKQRYFMCRKDKAMIYSAGLMSDRTDHETGEKYYTCAILTRAAVGHLADIHDRMPVIFSKEVGEDWLDPKLTDKDQIGQMIHDLAEDDFIAVPVAKNGLENQSYLDLESKGPASN